MADLKVTATQAGTYGGYRSAGEKFTLLKKEDFSRNWMSAVGWNPPARREKQEEHPFEIELKKAHAEIERLNTELEKLKK